MPRQLIQLLASFVFGLFVLWLLVRDSKRRNGVSSALWIPVTWMAILGSRPVSMWLGFGSGPETTNADVEGSPFDRNIWLLLILAALFVLSRRRIRWQELIAKNKWVFVYFLYLGLSVLWSDYSEIAFKRWVKDAGSVLMVLVVFTDDMPMQAIQSVFLRCAYLLIPTSLLLAKCFPYIGTFYDQWDGHCVYAGVASNKNMLGMMLFVCGLIVVWTLIGLRDRKTESTDKTELFTHVLLVLMAIYLLIKSRSSTAIGCSALGSGILLGMGLPALRSKVKRLGTYAFVLVILLLLMNTTFNLGELFLQVMGRDMTLTGRTDIWKDVLKEDIDPLIGAGHYSFWLSAARVERLSEGYYFKLNEAHNGYLEVYLNSGLIGLFLLIAVLASGAKRIKREIIAGSTYGSLQLALLLGIAAYGATEAVFRFSFIFFALLLVIMQCPRQLEAKLCSKPGQLGGYPSPVT